MRQVVLQMGVTVDGYVAGPGGDGDWGLPAEHPDVRAWKVASLRQVGTHIMGRVTYEQMAGHWPNATGDYAEFMNNLPKVVFSKTLPAAQWPGSRIARGDLAEEIAVLKNEPGGEIMAHGGAAFVQALSRLGLIDEYRLVILPVALGNGLPLFKDLAGPLRLDLSEAESFPGGTVIHVYRTIRPTRSALAATTLRLSAAAAGCLEAARREAAADGAAEVGTQHQLIGLFQEGVAAAVLEDLGVRADAARAGARELFPGGTSLPPGCVRNRRR